MALSRPTGWHTPEGRQMPDHEHVMALELVGSRTALLRLYRSDQRLKEKSERWDFQGGSLSLLTN